MVARAGVQPATFALGVVRNYARTLRKRLDDYFRKEGVDEPLVLSIPRGGYIPVFAPRVQVPRNV